MKNITFFLSMLMLLTISTNSVWGADVVVTLDNIGASIGSTANTSVSTTNITATGTSDSYTLNYYQCKKQGNAMLMTKSVSPFISNKTAMPGNIKSVEVFINSGASAKTTYNCAFSATELVSATAGVGAVNITGGNSNVFNKNVDGKYFCITLGNANNGQVLKIVVTCEGEAGGSDPIAVSGVSLDESEISLEVGETQALTATFTPANATNKSVTWTSNNTNVATVSNAGLVTAVGTGNATITVTTEDGNKTATCAVEVVAAPETGTFKRFTGSLVEGDYVIYYSGKAMNNIVSSNRLGYETVTPANDEISNPKESIIWHIAKSGNNWTIYNAAVDKYAASTGTKNQAGLLAELNQNNQAYGLWTVTGTETFDFVNVYNSNNNINANLRNNTTYGFACYASGTGGALTLYQKDDGKQNADLAYTDTKIIAKYGASFTKPALTNPHSLTVTYASDNTDVAEVDNNGNVTIKATGVASITASSEETENYKAGSASYTIGVTSHAGTEADPYAVADARLAIDCGAGVTGVYATGIVSEIVTPYNSQYGNISYNISTDGQTTSDQLQAFRGKAKDGENFTSVDDVKVGDEVVVKGNLTKYNSTYEFAADNQLYSLTRNKEDAGLAYAVTEIEKNVDDAAFTNALTNPHSLAVTYSSSAEAVATIDENGEVTIVGMGTTTIKATFAGDAVYLAGEASYTLKVNDPSLTKVTFDATVDKGESPLSKSNITLSCSNGVLNNESEYRLYKSSTTTFACSAGNIAMIEFIGVSGNPASGFAAPAKGNFVTDGNNATWTGNATSVSFEASGAQVRATKIFVSYREDTRTEAGLAYEVEEVEKVVGDEPFTNALTNPNSITVSYTSSDENVAEVNAYGQVTIIAVGTTTISAVFEGNETYKPATVSYTLTVAAPVAPFDGDYFVKVTSANDLTSGEYLIVYGEGSLAFNGALETLDAVSNTIPVIFDHDKIQGTNEALTAVFTIDATAGTIQSASGMYIGQTSDANGLATSAETAYTNTITFDEDGNANIVSGGAYLRYNSASNQTRFRYYKSSSYNNQQTIQLYKKESAEPVEPEHNYEVVRSGLEIGRHYTICMPKKIIAVRGATFWGINNGDETAVYMELQQPPFEAGTPFIFYATASTLEVVYEGDETTETVSNGALRGTLSYMDHAALTAAGSQVYLMYNNALHPLGTNNHLDANRAYLLFEELQAGAPAPGRQVKRMPLQTDVTTGVEDAETSTQPKKMLIDGQLFIRCGEKLYNATGSMVK